MLSCNAVSIIYMTLLVILHISEGNVLCSSGDFICIKTITKPTTASNEVVFDNLRNSENISSSNRETIERSLKSMTTTASEREVVNSLTETAMGLAVSPNSETIADSNEGGNQTIVDNDINKARMLRNRSAVTFEATTEPDRSDSDDARNPKKTTKNLVFDNVKNSAGRRTSIDVHEKGVHVVDNDFTVIVKPTSDLQESVSEMPKESEWPMLGLPGIENDEDMSLANITRAFNSLLPKGFAFEDMFVDLLSCHNRCGLSFESPCSCHSQCIIYNNCCPDFKVKCPSIVHEAVATFSSKLLQANVECRGSPPLNVLMVTTCPNATVEASSQFDNVEATSSFDNLDGSVEVQIQKVLERRPCTDMSTDITYINKDVYDCYATESSVLQYWIPMISLINVFTSPNSLEDFKSVLNFSDFTFQPAPGITFQKCPSEILDSCPDDNGSQDLQNKCTQGSMYYIGIRKWDKMLNFAVFPNIHCLLCNINGQKNKTVEILSTIYNKKFHSEFRAMMIVYDSGQDSGKVVFRSPWSNPTIWSQVDCDTWKESNPCQTTACKVNNNAVEDNCLVKMRIIVSLDSNFEKALEAIKEDLICAAHNNDLMQRPILQEVENKKTGHYVFYIQFLSWTTRSIGLTEVRNQFFDIIGYHLFNTARTELAAEKTKENCEPESMDTEISGRQRMPENTVAPDAIASSDRPTLQCNQTRDKQLVNQIVKARACSVLVTCKTNLDINSAVDIYCNGANTRVYEEESTYTKTPVFNRSQCGTFKKNPSAGSTEKQEPIERRNWGTNLASHIQVCMKTRIYYLSLSLFVTMISLVKFRS